jgi:ribosomal protein S18 acetylase RimI-like enzyme
MISKPHGIRDRLRLQRPDHLLINRDWLGTNGADATMTATVERYDPARHGAIVRDFVTSAAACAFGFRQEQLSEEDWQHLLARADAVGGKYIAVLLAEDGVSAVVAPTIRASPVFGPNAFLHVFGQPDSRMIAAMADHLSLEKAARFCQTLVSAEATEAQKVLLGAGGKHDEDEIVMRSENRPLPRDCDNRLEVIVRPAVPADASSLEQLHRDGFGQDISYAPRRFQISEGNDGLVLVAEHAKAVVGYCEIEQSGKDCWVDGLAVSESVRRSGIGTCLLNAALEKLPSGASVMLNVSSRNPAAIDLYEKFGFSEVRRERRYIVAGAHDCL